MSMVLGDLIMRTDSNAVVILGISDYARYAGWALMILGIVTMLAGCGVMVYRKKRI
jgi:LPXTG-motif cell wall-anchored protein